MDNIIQRRTEVRTTAFIKFKIDREFSYGKIKVFKHEIILESLNLSVGGMLASSNFDIDNFTILIFDFRSLGPDLEIKGQIIEKNKKGEKYIYRIQFIEMMPDMQDLLRNYIFKMQVKYKK